MSGVIPLSQGKVAIVDDEDFAWLNQWKWSALKTGRPGAVPKFYACRVVQSDGRQKMILMHRLITEAEKGLVVDHANLNTLDNRRLNLRVCSQSMNSLNQHGHRDRAGSRFKGVWWHKKNRRWVADFRGKYLGSFGNEVEAAAAYNAAALSYAPEYALPNAAMEV